MEIEGSKIFITGVGGFIGGRIARRAFERGAAVAGLEISEAAAGRAREIGVDVSIGDVNDPQAKLATAMRGADAVIHTAAIVREGGRLEDFRHVNVKGTCNVAAAARDAGVPRFVHLSSIMVHGFDFPPDVPEDGPRRGEGSPYCITKIEGEDALREMHDPDGLGVIIIRPGDVYGAGSMPWVERPRELMRQKLMLVPKTARVLNLVHVENLVDGVFLALEADAIGETFTITDGETVGVIDYFNRLADVCGEKRPRVMPEWVMRAAIAVQSAVLRIQGKEPEATPDAINFVKRPHAYSIDKARRRLGYKPRIRLDEGFAEIAKDIAARSD